MVAIHDAARPLATADLWARCHHRSSRARRRDPGGRGGAALAPRRQRRPRGAGRRADAAGVPCARTCSTAYRRADADGFVGTDTAACLERYAEITVVGVPSTAANLKVTFPEDLALAERLLSAPSS